MNGLRNTPRNILRIISIVVVLAAIACDFQGCGLPGVPGGPTPRPTVDISKLPPVAPQLIERSPYEGEELPLDGSIDLYFDQPMDQASVTGALTFEPSLEVDLSWVDDSTLRITPRAGQIQRDSSYVVTIATTAKSASGLAFEQPVEITVVSVGYLTVSDVVPAVNAGGVDPSSVITVLFNRPVVPLGIAEDAPNLPQPLRISPDVPGTGEWINTSIYQWRPNTLLAGGQTYQVTVASGLTDQTGGVLREDYAWTFTTLPPDVVSVSPSDSQSQIRLDEPIAVEFNQSMDHAATQAAFSLVETTSNSTVGGEFEWNEASTKFTFTPDSLMALDGVYRVSVGASATNSSSTATPLGHDVSWGFSAVHTPAIVSTDPTNGSAIKPYSGLRLTFSSPMDDKSLTADRISSNPPLPDDTTYFYSDYDYSWNVYGSLEPSTQYTITVNAGAADPHGNRINQPYTFSFVTTPADPLVVLNTTGRYGLYNASNPTQLFVNYRNISRIDFNLARIDLTEFGRLTNPSFYDAIQNFVPSPNQLVRQWSLDAVAPLNESQIARVPIAAEGTSLSPGIYLLIANAPEVEGDIRHFLIVANGNLTLKSSFDESMVWLTDLQSGAPMSQQTVTLYDENFNQISQVATNDKGVAEFATPRRNDLWGLRYAIVDSGGVFAVALSDWDEGIAAWEFNQPSNFYFEDFTLYMYTDRPLYRPGQEVFFKGVLRSKNDVTYTLPASTSINVEVINDQGESIFNQDVPVSEFGTFSSGLTLSESAGLGYYSIIAKVGELTIGQGFQVAQYRKPEFVVNVTPQDDAVLIGDTVNVDVDSQFFFGGPVSNAEVTWTVLAAPYFFSYEGPGNYSFGDIDLDENPFGQQDVPGFGEVVSEGDGTTDANGKLVISFPARFGKGGSSQTLTVEATVTDVNGLSVSNRATVIVHQGQVYVGVSPDNYVGNSGQSLTASLITVDWEGETVGGQNARVEFFEREWTCANEEDETGRTAFRCNVRNNAVGGTQNVTTGADGKATVSFVPPKPGSYKILAAVADSQGNSVRGSGFVWVTGSEYTTWRQPNNNRIDLVADKKSYEPGDTAQILIASPFQGGNVTALVTVERGSVLSYDVVNLTSNSFVYKLPLTGVHAPNVFVSVVLIKGVDETNPVPAFRAGLVKIAVDPVQQTIQVGVTPDTEVTGPGDTVTYTITTTDSQGKAINSEVSLALVDLALLNLAPPNSGKITDHFYGNSLLGVRTSIPMIYLVDRLNQELVDEGKGGGGGGAEGFFDVRSEFKDTAFWTATLHTGDSGTAQVTVTLPDNLTTWRMDARAVSKDTQVGQSEMDIVATRPLLIRPETPRFFVADDQATISAVVNNNTQNEIAAEVRLDSTGAAINGSPTQRVTIPAGGRVNVDWAIVVDSKANWVDLTFSVDGGGLQDASKPTLGDPANGQMLPVYRYEVPETVGTAGQLTDASSRIEGVALPPTYKVNQAHVDVEISPSLAASTVDTLDYLQMFPYDCTEQTVSKFLPNAVTLLAFRQFDLADGTLEANLEISVNSGLQKLYAQQHTDGGWGWFVNSQSNPMVSAYVIQGMVAAQQAGFQIDARVMDDGLFYLKNQLVALDSLSAQYALHQQTYILFVLAQAGQPDVSRTTQMYETRLSIQHYAKALLAQTMWMIDPADPRLNDLKSDLINSAILSATGAHWEEDSDDVWNWNTDTRSTAIILDTFAKLWPDNDLAPNATRWLMIAKRGSHWETTQETVWGLIGLSDWMVATKELDAAYDWEFQLNGQTWASGKADASTVRQSTKITIDLADLLTDHVNRFMFGRSAGTGRMYYTARLTVNVPVEEVQPLSRGVIISRQYLDSEGTRVTEARDGDVITVRLSIIAPNDLYYLVVEDFYPAGAEAVNTNLLTESVTGERPVLRPDDPLYDGWGWWWFSETELRDEKAVLFADYLPRGTYEYTYQIRLGSVGKFHVIPPVAREFYLPEVYGRGAGSIFTVLPKQ